jgi:hypothetical protein
VCSQPCMLPVTAPPAAVSRVLAMCTPVTAPPAAVSRVLVMCAPSHACYQ